MLFSETASLARSPMVAADGERLAVERQRAVQIAGPPPGDGQVAQRLRDHALVADAAGDGQRLGVHRDGAGVSP